ncbi:site-specific integrase [Microtetraspora sp. NBRC 16547]|uniref:tyrosine-type recombinase/integrase n=1 Tax=Microtetraspora sp. NBRC 16547 TaxID=3030993 RepID=UPI0024A11B7C|nr:site-specific integrase [Microtetraspora sp. NBRC 16547]GLW98803.1 site-specific integrase [Microtetraspora sp. NBRC 16547]
MAEGTTFKRCSCKDGNGKPYGQKCPKLRRPGGAWSHRHGSWNYQLELPPTAEGKRRGPLRRGGFESQDVAETELAQVRELLALADPLEPKTRVQIADLIKKTLAETGNLPGAETVRRKVRRGHDLGVEITVGAWLEEFLKRKRTIEETTRRSYEGHIRLYLIPYLGHLRLDRLKVSHIADMFDEIEEFNTTITDQRRSGDPQIRASVKYRRPIGVSTMHSIRATLRHALNMAIRQDRLIDFNPAAVLEMPPRARPKALVWTDERVKQWRTDFRDYFTAEKQRRGGRRVDPIDAYVSSPRPSSVMVWTPAQTRLFLEEAAQHRLFAMYRLITVRGLRRGEACGLRWKDVNLEAGMLTINWQLVQLAWGVHEGKPKTDASERTLALDSDTIAILRAHRTRQLQERMALGEAWKDTGFVFTQEDGDRLHPQYVSDQFLWLAYMAGLPPIRLHDLRHGAASLMLAAGVEMKVVQETLGHTSSAFTADTYTSVFPEVAKAAAEKTAALLSMNEKEQPVSGDIIALRQ